MYSISEEEKALFYEAVADIRVLKVADQKIVDIVVEKPLWPLSDNYHEVLKPEEGVYYLADVGGLSSKVLQQIQQGKYRMERIIDLHGDTIESARYHLSQALQQAQDAQIRYVLIIHGKGEQAILKNHVIHWLKQMPWIVFFCSAQPKDGGTGALYVFLKKSEQLAVMRQKIDVLDKKLVELLCQRLSYAKQIAELKKTTIQDKTREQEVMANIRCYAEALRHPEALCYLEAIFQMIFTQMRQYQTDK